MLGMHVALACNDDLAHLLAGSGKGITDDILMLTRNSRHSNRSPAVCHLPHWPGEPLLGLKLLPHWHAVWLGLRTLGAGQDLQVVAMLPLPMMSLNVAAGHVPHVAGVLALTLGVYWNPLGHMQLVGSEGSGMKVPPQVQAALLASITRGAGHA